MPVPAKGMKMEGWMKENTVLYVCASATVLGLYAMSHSWHSLWALAMLAFVNMPKKNA